MADLHTTLVAKVTAHLELAQVCGRLAGKADSSTSTRWGSRSGSATPTGPALRSVPSRPFMGPDPDSHITLNEFAG